MQKKVKKKTPIVTSHPNFSQEVIDLKQMREMFLCTFWIYLRTDIFSFMLILLVRSPIATKVKSRIFRCSRKIRENSYRWQKMKHAFSNFNPT